MVKPIDVQYYDLLKGELVHTQEHKAQKFIENDCIVWDIEEKCFLCKPIEGYNIRTYTLKPEGDGHYTCNCQGYRKKVKLGETPFCSHIFALVLWFKTHNKNIEQKTLRNSTLEDW